MQGKLRDEPSRRSREWGSVDRDIMWYTRSILVGWLGGEGAGGMGSEAPGWFYDSISGSPS